MLYEVITLITLRADFYDRPLMHPEFSHLMRDYTEVVVPLTAIELGQAISQPANRVGVQLEPELVSAIITEVKDEPGALPLLQYALTELFEQRQDQTLTVITSYSIHYTKLYEKHSIKNNLSKQGNSSRNHMNYY